MIELEHKAKERVAKARARLILERRFYGVLVSNVEPQVSRRVPTAATNGKVHLWNPEFVETLTEAELLGVQAHESEHDARHHGTRRGSRDPVKWNIAGDYSINIDLIGEGFTLPKGHLIDEKYRGLSAEDIYRMRELDEQRKQTPPNPEPEDADDESDDDDQDDDDADSDDADGDTDGDDADTDDGDDEGDEAGDSDDAESDAEGDGADTDGDDAKGEGQSEGDGDGEGDADDDEGEGEGSGSGEAGEGEAEGQGAGGGEPSDDEDDGESELGSGDPGGCGEVLDSEHGEAEIAEDDAKWDRVVRQAASMAKAVGQLPAYITRELERANNPPRDWRDELREFAEEGALRIETWNRPNRRFIGRGLVLPSTQKDGINKAAFLIDTSGSCDAIALACVRDEAQAMLDDGIIDHIVVVYGDTQVARVDEYMTGDEIEFDPRGGGGTDMEPLFRYVAEEHDDASLVVCFTDLEFYKSCGAEPACPVLWAVHGYPQRVKELMQRTPWDARAIDVGAH